MVQPNEDCICCSSLNFQNSGNDIYGESCIYIYEPSFQINFKNFVVFFFYQINTFISDEAKTNDWRWKYQPLSNCFFITDNSERRETDEYTEIITTTMYANLIVYSHETKYYQVLAKEPTLTGNPFSTQHSVRFGAIYTKCSSNVAFHKNRSGIPIMMIVCHPMIELINENYNYYPY